MATVILKWRPEISSFTFENSYSSVVNETNFEFTMCKYAAPCGNLILASFNGALCLCVWENQKIDLKKMLPFKVNIDNKCVGEICKAHSLKNSCPKVLKVACRELDEYFAKKRKNFDVPISFWTNSNLDNVMAGLKFLDYGSTISYSEFALRLNSHAYRNIARLLGKNLLQIFLPCHRVIEKGGGIGGYAGGVIAKKFLLELERAR